jgi:hypothetical protein
METPGQTCQRLLGALETLASEEQFAVRQGKGAVTLAVQQRAETVIARLAELLDDPEIAAQAAQTLLPRLASLQEHRAQTLDLMGERLTEISDHRASLNAARHRLDGMKSVYATPQTGRRSTPPGFNRSA